MKIIKFFILLLIAINTKNINSEQINQSTSNLESIEIKSNPNDKEPVLLDKPNTKILAEKNASELDDVKKVESILDEITDLNELTDTEKQKLLQINTNIPIELKTIDSQNDNSNQTKEFEQDNLNKTHIDENIQQTTSTATSQQSETTATTQTVTDKNLPESLEKKDNQVSTPESVVSQSPTTQTPQTQSTSKTEIKDELFKENIKDKKAEDKNETILEASTPESIVQVSQSSSTQSPQESTLSPTNEIKEEPLNIHDQKVEDKNEIEANVPILENSIKIEEQKNVEKNEVIEENETTTSEQIPSVEVVVETKTETPVLTEKIQEEDSQITPEKTEESTTVETTLQLPQTTEEFKTEENVDVTEKICENIENTSETTNIELNLSEKIPENLNNEHKEEIQVELVPTVYPENEKINEQIEINLPTVSSKPQVESLNKRFRDKLKNKLSQDKEENIHEHEHHHLHDHHHHHENETKPTNHVCANLDQVKKILNENFEPLYLPLVNLLPDDIQLILSNEYFGGLSNVHVLVVLTSMFLLTSLVYLLLKTLEGKKINVNSILNEQLLVQTNKLKQLEFDMKTYQASIEDYEQRITSQDSILNEKDFKLKELSDKLSKSLKEQEFSDKEIGKLKTNENKLIKELNQLKTDLTSLNDVFTQNKLQYAQQTEEKDTRLNELTEMLNYKESRIQEYEVQLTELCQIKDTNLKLESELAESRNKIEILTNSLSIKNKSGDLDDFVQVDSPQNLDSLLSLGQLQMDLKNLQEKYDCLLSDNEAKQSEIDELKLRILHKESESSEYDSKMKKFEKQIKENEMQIRLLNELREKDTKQHLKALSELDMQLKKKTTDADKVSHYMEQLRVKQERIQELETNLSRVEKQSNQERQTFEKQSHENWLNAKKLDKELKETRMELSTLKERLRELELGQSQMENIVEEQQPPRPPSTSSNPGGIMPHNGPGFMPFIRPPPFRLPFPPPINPAQAVAFMQQHLEQQQRLANSASPNQDQLVNRMQNMPNIPPPNPLMYQRMLQTQQYFQHQMASSATSSQQVSPNDLSNNVLASTALNDSSMMNNLENGANHTNHYPNDTEFDYSSNLSMFNNQNNQDMYQTGANTNHNSNENFNV
ncbi:unnamed protein product [Brachionus calyciflorus]|uniref:Uncharacterized protein n=1 Tax=Brachionus calyciflorus TaxID=104777 RepID=A0A814DNZ0_9BILA|nr:unnamed protein product [Brachionus calyciflorus]